MTNLNINNWFENIKTTSQKKSLPILSFPCVSLLNTTVKELISNSDLQSKGMKLVADRVDSYASVSFMDLSVEAECFGATVFVSDDEVPTVKGRVVNNYDDAVALSIPKIGSGRTSIYIEAIEKATKAITDRPVFAGMIGPFSLAGRLLDVSEIMMDCYDDPDMVHLVLEKSTNFLIEYAKAYKAVGANGIVIAEPVAGLLSPSLEAEFSSPYIKKLVDAVQDDNFAVIYHNCGDNVSHMVDSIVTTGCAAYHFGNAVDMEEMILKMPQNSIVMGNIDPVGTLRMGTPDTVKETTLSLLERCSKYPNFVLSSGCDIPPLTPWKNIEAFFESANEFYER